MPLHIEINGDVSPQEWDALAAFVAVMRGTTALTSVKQTVNVTGDTPIALPDVDPIEPAPSVAVVPPPPPAADPAPNAIADAMIEAEEKRVAAASTGAAPVAPPPPPPAPVGGGVELDATGLPWDLRIHASTKAKNANGSWRNKRGVEPALVTQVEAELRQVMAAPAAPTGDTPIAPPPVEADPAAAFAAPAAPPPPPPPAAEPDPAPSNDLTAFANTMKLVVAKQTAGTVSPEQVSAICQQLGLTGVRDLAKRPDLVPAFEALLP